MSFYFDTVEAGAGSYPEPPYTPEPVVRECEECYETRWLEEIDGKLLCPHCRADYIFENSTDEDRQAFINSGSQDDLKDFYLAFYFEDLSSRDKLRIVRQYFEQNVSDSDKEFLSKTYVEELKGDFAEFMERRVKRRGA